MTLRLPSDPTLGPFSGDKILCHPDRIAALMAGDNPAPVLVELDMTNRCQLACPYCANAEYRQSQGARLGIEAASRVIREMAALGVEAVSVTGGGEPLTDPATIPTMRLANSLGLDVGLITNGVQMTAGQAEDIVRYGTWARISVDSYDSESYFAAKGRYRWEIVLDNINVMVQAKRRIGSNCTIGIGYLTDASTVRYFPDCVQVFANSGVDYVQARPIMFLPGDSRDTGPLSIDVLPLIEAQRYRRDDFKVYVSWARYDTEHKGRQYAACTAVLFSCAIGATGDVWICCHWRGAKRFSIGNIHERSFADIWQDTETRNRVYAGIRLDECMQLCRFHRQNTLLAGINWKPMHSAFL